MKLICCEKEITEVEEGVNSSDYYLCHNCGYAYDYYLCHNCGYAYNVIQSKDEYLNEITEAEK